MVTEHETYNFMIYQFYVYELYKWAKENLETVAVNLAEIAKPYGFVEREGYHSIFSLDREYALKLSEKDVKQPLLIVDLGKGGHLMIDGTHRSFNMWSNGTEQAPAYLIQDKDIIIKYSNITKKMFKHIQE